MAEDEQRKPELQPATLTYATPTPSDARAGAMGRIVAGCLLSFLHFVLYFVLFAPAQKPLIAVEFLHDLLGALWIAPAMLMFATLKSAGVEWSNGAAFLVLAINSVLYGFGAVYLIGWLRRRMRASS